MNNYELEISDEKWSLISPKNRYVCDEKFIELS